MKGIYFKIGCNLTLEYELFDVDLKYSLEEYNVVKSKIQGGRLINTSRDTVNYSSAVEEKLPGEFNYKLNSFNFTTVKEEVYVTSNGPYLVAFDGNCQLYIDADDLTKPPLKEKLGQICKEVGIVDYNVKASMVGNNIKDLVLSHFNRNFKKESMISCDKEYKEELDFFMKNSHRIVSSSLAKPDIVKKEFDEAAFNEIVADRFVMRELANSYEVNKYLATHYTFDNPSVWLIKFYKFVKVNDYQYSQSISPKLESIFSALTTLISGYGSDREIQKIKKLFVIPEEQEKLQNELAFGLSKDYHFAGLCGVKFAYPEFLEHLRVL